MNTTDAIKNIAVLYAMFSVFISLCLIQTTLYRNTKKHPIGIIAIVFLVMIFTWPRFAKKLIKQ